jgi:hypothetical protein
MKTLLSALLACLLIGTADAQQRVRISRQQWDALLKEDWDHGCRLWREGRITVEQYAKWRDDAWKEMVAQYGNPPERPRPAIKSPEQIELEAINDELRRLRLEVWQHSGRRCR